MTKGEENYVGLKEEVFPVSCQVAEIFSRECKKCTMTITVGQITQTPPYFT